ncbi:MAG: putative oxidoreductase [Verrucomicrobiales bacterium]|nr:putative oxidoreductase [Verrucomicrobiales bacterium]
MIHSPGFPGTAFNLKSQLPQPHSMQNDSRKTCEVCVIGSGPGGAITAALLAEAGMAVILLEEGPFLSQETCAPFSVQEMTMKYRNGGITPAFGKPKVTYVEGCCVGGGSEINSGLYHRTPPAVLESWQKEFALKEASVQAMEPYFARCEAELSVSTMPYSAPAPSLKLHQGATALGWKSMEIPRWYKYEIDSSQASGYLPVRQSMTRTFIPRFLAAGGTIIADTKAHRLLRGSNATWEVNALQKKSQEPINISAEHVFICAGAIQTPLLLLRSHLGSNVGRSLQLHPTIKITAEFPEVINTKDLGVPVHQVKEFSPRLSFGCSISSPPYLALGLLESERAEYAAVASQRMANYYAMITSSARGRISSLPGYDDPLVRYNLQENDFRVFKEGFTKLSQILFESGAVRLFPAVQGVAPVSSPDELPRLLASVVPSKTNVMTIHLFSACPMGEDKSKCALNSFGQLHDLKNLYVNDSSMLCSAPGVNPQGSVMAFARRNVLHFLESRRKA